MKDIYKAKPYIRSAADILTCTPEQYLSDALAFTRQSHDAVLVYEKKGTFLGLISPYHAIFEHRFPYEAKVKRCLFVPPKITEHAPLYQVAQYMLDTRIYTLPVVNDAHEVVGVITAHDILKGAAQDHIFFENITDRIEMERPLVAPETITVRAAYRRLKKNKTTRLVLVSDHGRLSGIVTRSDIQCAVHRTAPNEGFAMRVGNQRNWLLVENEIRERKLPAKDFATPLVVTAKLGESMHEVTKHMIDKEVSSVVFIDEQDKPVGIISVRSFLKALASMRHEIAIPVIVHHQPRGVSDDYTVRKVRSTLERFGAKLHRRLPLHYIEVYMLPTYNAVGRVKEYTFVLAVHFWSGLSYRAQAESFIAKAKAAGFETILHQTMREIESQMQRDHQVAHRHERVRV
jgi:CBS domain-containing protein